MVSLRIPLHYVNIFTMEKILIICVVFLLVLPACEKEESPPSDKGDITVSSEIFGSTVYYVNGYSFEEEKFIPNLNSKGTPDIVCQNVLDKTGSVIGMMISAFGVSSFGFYKNFESRSFTEAEEFFSGYKTVEVEQFYPLSDTIQAGQVYTFRTTKKNYVKILVKDVRIKNDSPLSDYVEADIRYYIQRDGAEVFDE